MYYYYFYSFIIYSFIGWTMEVLYHIYKEKNFVNRGFLFGPLCPIYGVTSVLLIFFLTPYSKNMIYLFFGGFLLASLIEYVTGYIMEKLFNAKWWDYSNEKYNLKGYVCLKFSFIWGIMSLAFIKIINPSVSKITYLFTNEMGKILYNIILILLIIDIVITVNGLITFRKLFIELEEVISETRANIEKLNISSISKEIRETIQTRLGILNEVKEGLSQKITMKQRLLLKAFPNIKSSRFQTAIEDLRKRLNN